MSSFALIVAVASATPAQAAKTEKTIEQRVHRVRDILEQQNHAAISDQQASEDQMIISQWYNNWTNNPWGNWSNTGWYNNWTNYNP